MVQENTNNRQQGEVALVMSPANPEPSSVPTASNLEAVQLLVSVILASLPGIYIGVLASAMKICHGRISTMKSMVRTAVVSTLSGGIAAVLLKPALSSKDLAWYVGGIFLISFCADAVLNFLPRLVPGVLKTLFNTTVSQTSKSDEP